MNTTLKGLREANACIERWEPLIREGGMIVILTGYIDESYDGRDHPDDFTLACIMASADDWKHVISPKWRTLFASVNQELSRQGRRQITRYKAAECNGSYDEFEGWTQPEKLALTKQMSEVFDHTELKLTQAAWSVRLSRIHQKIPSIQDPKSFAYAMLFMLIVKDVLASMDRLWENSTISFIHDRCDYDEVYLAVFNLMLRLASPDEKKKLTTVASLPNLNCPPLEVADLIAYENYKHHINQAEGKLDKRTIDYLLQDDRLGGKSKVIRDENFAMPEDVLNFLKWCSSYGGKRSSVTSSFIGWRR